jgi:hypothetical protein
MKYVSIDIETTGINPEWCDILEFGAIIEDTQNQKSYEEVPKFHRYLKPPRPEGYRGETYAINMHADTGIWKEINRIEMLQNLGEREGGLTGQDAEDIKKLIAPRKLLNEFTCFLIDNGFEDISKERGQSKVNLGNVTVAGKCFFAFDWNFLAPLFGERICRRAIDPAIWYWNPTIDKKLPATPLCLERAGIKATDAHTSLGDAWDVIRLVRHAMNIGLTVPQAWEYGKDAGI